MSDMPPPPSTPPPPPPPDGGSASEPANFGQRLGAMLIDLAIFWVPGAIVMYVALSVVPTELVICQNGTAICEQPTGAGFGILALIYLAILVGFLWYIAEFDGRRGATIGRRALGTKVVRIGTDEPIGAGRAIGRWFGRIISGIPCYLGYLWMLWDDKSQTWHDKMTDAQVVKA